MTNRIINGTINGVAGYPAAVSIDPVNDYLLLQQSSVYKSINRNVLLGISGTPVGTSDSQSLSNKTLDNTVTITAKSNRFTLQDATDITKQAAFDLSGITTGTTRTYKLPNASSTLVDLASVQTLTGKTLTSPTVTGGTIDNTTITVDSISGHTSPTIVSIAGVQLNNGTIGTSNAVTTASLTDGAVTPNKLVASSGSGWAYQTYSPTWTNLTVGNGTLVARYQQTGKNLYIRIELTFGTTTTVSGSIGVSLPVTAVSSYTNLGSTIGWANYFDSSASAQYQGRPVYASTTTAQLQSSTVAATLVRTDGAVNASTPMTWALGDILMVFMLLEVA